MTISQLGFPKVLLRHGDDVAAARAIEAGVYASYLIQRYGPKPDLERLVALGEEASRRLWWVGARIAILQARRLAETQALPFDELFQDACVAVADGIRRYDFLRGVRFTTFIFQQVIHALRDSARYRPGNTSTTRGDRRAAYRVKEARTELRRAGLPSSIDDAIAAAGVSPAAAARGLTRVVSLEAELLIDPLSEPAFEQVETHGCDFLALLSPHHRAVLELRFGLTGPAKTLAESAQLLGAAPSTVSRWERAAIQAARELLTAERTTAPGLQAPSPPGRRHR